MRGLWKTFYRQKWHSNFSKNIFSKVNPLSIEGGFLLDKIDQQLLYFGHTNIFGALIIARN